MQHSDGSEHKAAYVLQIRLKQRRAWDARDSESDRELKLDSDFVDVGPLRQLDRPVLEHNASGFVHDKAEAYFRGVAGFGLPDHFHGCRIFRQQIVNTHKPSNGRSLAATSAMTPEGALATNCARRAAQSALFT